MSKAPDTRGKIDKQSNINPQRKKPVIQKQSEKKYTNGNRVTLGDLKIKVDKEKRQQVKDQSPLKLKADKKESKGAAFKRQHGYSKTAKRLMRLHGTDLQGLKERRKARKLAEKKVRQKKHADSSAYKRAHGKSKGSKGKAPAPKKVEVKQAA
jgi:hypothetical protein